jgi:hypothetical protein
MTKSESAAVGCLIVVGLIFGVVASIVAGIGKIVDAIGWVFPLIICVAVISAIVWYNNHQKTKRLEYLRQKYGDESIVPNIIGHRYWQG